MRLVVLGLLLAACSSESGERPAAGTPTDPVETCTRLADVCRFDGSQLGVCIEAPANKRPARCQAGKPCFICAPQH